MIRDLLPLSGAAGVLPRRVLMTADTVGGVWTHAIELLRAFKPHGVRIILATMGAPVSAFQRREVEALPYVTLFESRYALEWMDSPWAEVDQAGQWLLGLEAQTGPDVIHLNGYVHAALPWKAPVMVVAHSCVLSWWQAVKNEPAPGRFDEYRERVRAGLRAAAMLIAPSAAMLDSVEEFYGVTVAEAVIPNARDGSVFQPGEKSAVIFASGRLWDEAKNIALLERIAPFLSWPVVVAGESHHPNGRCLQWNNLRAVGVLAPDQLAAALSQAGIYAAPALYEPFGFAILEAALCGCALVLSDVPSLRENWTGAAVFVPPGDEAAWCGVLNMLAANEQLRGELGRRACIRAGRFSPSTMAGRYLAAYDALAKFPSRYQPQPQ